MIRKWRQVQAIISGHDPGVESSRTGMTSSVRDPSSEQLRFAFVRTCAAISKEFSSEHEVRSAIAGLVRALSQVDVGRLQNLTVGAIHDLAFPAKTLQTSPGAVDPMRGYARNVAGSAAAQSMWKQEIARAIESDASARQPWAYLLEVSANAAAAVDFAFIDTLSTATRLASRDISLHAALTRLQESLDTFDEVPAWVLEHLRNPANVELYAAIDASYTAGPDSAHFATVLDQSATLKGAPHELAAPNYKKAIYAGNRYLHDMRRRGGRTDFTAQVKKLAARVDDADSHTMLTQQHQATQHLVLAHQHAHQFVLGERNQSVVRGFAQSLTRSCEMPGTVASLYQSRRETVWAMIGLAVLVDLAAERDHTDLADLLYKDQRHEELGIVTQAARKHLTDLACNRANEQLHQAWMESL